MHSNSWAKVYILLPQVRLLASLIKPHQLTVTIERDDGSWDLKQKMHTRTNIFSVSLWALDSFHHHRPFTGWPELVLLTPFPFLSPPSPLLILPSPLPIPPWLLQLPCCSLEQRNFLLPGDLCSPCPTCWSSEDPSDFITSEELPPLQKTPELSGTSN